MKKRISSLLLIVVALGSIAFAYISLENQFKFVHIVSNSMAPLIQKGDLILVKSVETRNLKIGQIAILPHLNESGIFYAHRIVDLAVNRDGEIEVQTKGDANPIADSDPLVITSKKTPIYLGVIPISQAPGLLKNTLILATIFALISFSLLVIHFTRRKREYFEKSSA